MILCTGDIHGDVMRLVSIDKKNQLTNEDYILVAGDFGVIWNEDNAIRRSLNYIEKNVKATVLFIDGNHENFEKINAYKVKKWNGGKVHFIRNKVIHLMRGQIFTIDNINIFTFGGARSIDKEQRIEGKTWWAAEEPTPEEIKDGKKILEENLDKIDYIITHECPNIAFPFTDALGLRENNYLLPQHFDSWFEYISHSKKFKKWIFGHMHANKVIGPHLRAIYTDVIML